MPDKLKDPEFEIEDVDIDESKQQKKQEEQELPAYFRQIEPTEDQETDIVKEIMEEFDAIKKERETDGLEKGWEGLWNQYRGKLEKASDRQFNLHKPTTKVKIRGIGRLINQAFFESDPTYNISPRPEFASEGGNDVTEKQTDFLDYKLDTEIDYQKTKRKVVLASLVTGTGLDKMYHYIDRRRRRRQERWKGETKPLIDPKTGQQIILDGIPQVENKPFLEFISKYPDASQKHIKALSEDKEINIEVAYWDLIKNDPMPRYVENKNFYVRKSTDGYEGLKTTRLIVERTEYFWHELKEEERKGNFRNIDDLSKEKNEKGEISDNPKAGYENEKYAILECTYMAKIDNDDERVKCVFWIDEETKKMIGSIYFPWQGLDTIYNPHYVLQEEEGFWQPGVAQDLTDLNIAEDAFLNFGLEGTWLSNMITPITPKNSDIDQQFINKTWSHGMPLNIKQDETPAFLQSFLKPTNLNDILVVLNVLSRAQDDVSGHSALQTGRESPIDPRAPAAKTIALLEQSGINIRDYIKSILPSFNRTAEMMLQMYYQISEEGRQYKINPERVVGEDIFSEISRNEMIARTNIQAKALAFDFDKVNEKRMDVALYQILRAELMIAKRPESVHSLLKNLIKSWSPKWKNIIDSILPTLQELKKEEAKIALQAAAQYLEIKQKEAEAQGQQLNVNLQELVGVVDQARSSLVTPPPEEKGAK